MSPPRRRRDRGRTPNSVAALRAALPNSGSVPDLSAGTTGVVLVTGFEPFGGEKSNPSWDLCALLPRTIAGAKIETLRVPCEFRRSIETVVAAIKRLKPGLVVCVGQAGGRSALSFERVAINVDDARIPDNAGAAPVDEPVDPSGPPACFATLPIKAMVAAARAAGVPAVVSNSAGTYVCNHLMYGVLHYIAAKGLATRAGFVHVPYADHQVRGDAAVPSMAVAAMARGLEAAIGAALEHRADLKVAEGAFD